MFGLPDLTHIVIVAGDSDYVPLAQRIKRLGRYVVGIGVAGSTSRTLAAACDEFYSYDALPGIERPTPPEDPQPAADTTADAGRDAAPKASASSRSTAPVKSAKSTAKTPPSPADDDEDASRDPQLEATGLLERALRIGHEKDDTDWLHSSAVKTQIKRMDPSFSEKQLGFRSFSDFIKSRSDIAELDDSSTAQLVRLKPAAATPKRAPRRAKG